MDEKSPASAASVTAPTLEASKLLGDRREVNIRFRGIVYRLRVTRNDKLILTK